MNELSPFPTFAAPELAGFELAGGVIDLWCADLKQPDHVVAALERHLSPDEVERADRFRFPRHRRRHVVSRGVLRRLLAAYTGLSPDELRFGYGEKGKPFLIDLEAPPIFNLSHSDELVLIGVTENEELGVDVERLRDMPDALSISEHFFSAEERVDLRSVPETQISSAFFNCWTRKEAYIKAVGDGLSVPLDCFDVTLIPGQKALMRSLDGDPQKGAEWSLYHFEPVAGYVGALAIKGQGWKLVGHNLDPARLASVRAEPEL